MNIKKGQTILFIGDSITDMGRRGAHAPLGDGYVKLFSDMLIIRQPARGIRVINKGIGGDVVTGLRGRWHDDVLRNKPDWLSIKIGINDLHGFVVSPETGVSPTMYRDAYDTILARTRSALPKCKLLLIDPFFLSTERDANSGRGEVLKTLPVYTRIVGDMSKKYKTLHIKTHEMFQRILKHHDSDTLCPEPVHPHLIGHLAIADAVYDALS